MKILLITDIHYGRDAKYPKLGGENYINSFGSHFESYVSKIKSAISDHDLIVNLGDSINEIDNEQDIINYKKVMEFLGQSKPVVYVIGNHDLNCLSREQIAKIIDEPKLYYSFDLQDYHHIILDGTRDSRDTLHRIDSEQLNWLKNDLAKTNLPTIIYCHYPIDNQDVSDNYYFSSRPERAFISNKQQVREVLESSNKVIGVFNGHLHFSHEETINGIRYITIPSFSENDTDHKPLTEYCSVLLENKALNIKIIKI